MKPYILLLLSCLFTSCGRDAENVMKSTQVDLSPDEQFVRDFFNADPVSKNRPHQEDEFYVFERDIDTCEAALASLAPLYKSLPFEVVAKGDPVVHFIPGDYLSQAGRYESDFQYYRFSLWPNFSFELEERQNSDVVVGFSIERRVVNGVERRLGIFVPSIESEYEAQDRFTEGANWVLREIEHVRKAMERTKAEADNKKAELLETS